MNQILSIIYVVGEDGILCILRLFCFLGGNLEFEKNHGIFIFKNIYLLIRQKILS